MLDYPASGQTGTKMNKMPMPEIVRYRNKGSQSDTGMLRYRTEMPLPSFDDRWTMKQTSNMDSQWQDLALKTRQTQWEGSSDCIYFSRQKC